MRTIIFSVAAMFALQSTAQASQQLAPPGPDWRPFNASGSGVVASYNLPDQHGDSAHSVVAIVSSNYTSLDDFVQRNRALLKRTPGLSVLSERRVQA